jgi:hypothetical protein
VSGLPLCDSGQADLRGIREELAMTDPCGVERCQASGVNAGPVNVDDTIWNAKVGPFYDETHAREVLGARFAMDALLATVAGDGSVLFPTFQFDDEGAPLPHLTEILDVLRTAGEDPWGHALWLNTPTPAFGGRTAAELLRLGGFQKVRSLAESDAARWRK